MLTIERNYLRKTTIWIALLMLIPITLSLVCFEHPFWGILTGIFSIAFLIHFVRGYVFHKELINWIDNNSDAILFIYGSKRKTITFIEEDLIPVLPERVVVVKNDNAIITGMLKRSIYRELYETIQIGNLPLIISFNGCHYRKESFKYLFSQLEKGLIESETIISTVLQHISTPLEVNNALRTNKKQNT